MNLEYDADESSLLRQAGEVLQKVARVPHTGSEGGRAGVWAALAAAGWGEVGSAVDTGELALPVAIDLFRRAGQQLYLDEYVTSGFLLSAISACVVDAGLQDGLQRSLRHTPGVLLGDGRTAAVPVLSEDDVDGHCFGWSAGCDVHRLVRRGERYVLQRWDGAEPAAIPLADLSHAVASVRVDASAGRWVSYELAVTAQDLERWEAQALIVHSAGLIGCGERLLEITGTHTRNRVQFGVPIGSFQAVKHGLADVYTALVVAWNATLGAVADGSDHVLAPLVVRVLAVEAALAAARTAAQFHGGIGFTAELNVHLFLKTVLDGVQRFTAPDDVAAELGRRFAQTAC